MPTKKYGKLVRDKIPEIIEANGGKAVCETLSRDAFIPALEAKLAEELAEYKRDKSLEELADILEVVYALAKVNGASREELEAMRAKKACERGGFDERVFLVEVKEA